MNDALSKLAPAALARLFTLLLSLALLSTLSACEEEALVAGPISPWGDVVSLSDLGADPGALDVNHADAIAVRDVGEDAPNTDAIAPLGDTSGETTQDAESDALAGVDDLGLETDSEGAAVFDSLDTAGELDADIDADMDAKSDTGPNGDVGSNVDAGPATTCEVGAAEQCNGLDDDCDGLTDEGLCEDGNSCTLDFCKLGVCAHKSLDGPCDDDDLCTLKDTCAGGACGGVAVACDDGDVCTWDVCHPATGACHWLPIPGLCGACLSDSDCAPPTPCALGLACKGGKCVDTGAVQVDTLLGPSLPAGGSKSAGLQGPSGLAFTAAGDLLIADRAHHLVLKLDENGTLHTLAGKGSAGYSDGVGAAAAFYHPSDLVAGPGAQAWIVDTDNHRLRHLAATGLVTTVAGMTAGFADGKGLNARFNQPRGVARSSGGVLYIADTGNHRLRVLRPDGMVTTLAGGVKGYANGQGVAARFSSPWALAVDRHGRILVADWGNHRLRRVTPQGLVTDLAGSTQGSLDGPVGAAKFSFPSGIAVDRAGRIFVAELGNHRIRRLTPGGKVWTLAGSGIAGMLDGPALLARFNGPQGLAVSVKGELAVADSGNHRVRRVRDSAGACLIGQVCYAQGIPSTALPCLVCGPGKTSGWSVMPDKAQCDDGQLCTGDGLCSAGQCAPGMLTTCDDGDPCTKDACDVATGACVNAHVIGCGGYCDKDSQCQDLNPCLLGEVCVDHQCDLSGSLQVQTEAGGAPGMIDGQASSSAFKEPNGISFSATGVLYVADRGNQRVRGLTPAGQVFTVAGAGVAGFADGDAKVALFDDPSDVAVDPAGTLWVADSGNNRLRQISGSGAVSTLVGLDPGFVDGSAAVARFNRPVALAMNVTGVAYVVDYFNNRIRRVMPDGSVGTLAGSVVGHANGYGAAARFNHPVGLDVDRRGWVYVADRDNHRLRRISPEGLVSDIAGGAPGFVDGPVAKARFFHPRDVLVGDDGRLWVADAFNNRVRVVDKGVVQTLAGTGVPGFIDGRGDKARFMLPSALALDPWGWLHVADQGNHRLRVVRQTKGACFISGVCWSAGHTKSSGACDLCGPASTTAWSTAPNGMACGAVGLCQEPGKCLGGVCQVGASKSCDDAQSCTLDSCDLATGACAHEPISGCP